MNIKLGKSKAIIHIPNGYKKQKESIKELGNAPVYIKGTSNSTNVITVFIPDNPMAFDSETLLDDLIIGTREALDANTGIVEIDEGVTSNGLRYGYGICKCHREEMPGNLYTLRMDILAEGVVYEIQGSFEEIGTTGFRDSIVFSILSNAGIVGHDYDDAFEGWSIDPYDSSYKEGFLMNLSEKIGFDNMFPEHALSQARSLVDAIIYGDEAIKEHERFEKRRIKSKAKSKEDNTTIDSSSAEKTDSYEQCKGLLEYSLEDKKEYFNKLVCKDSEEDKNTPSVKGDTRKKLSLNEQLQNAINEYNYEYELLKSSGINHYHQQDKSIDLIEFVENLINSLANHPKSYDTDLGEISESKKVFKDADQFAKEQLESAKRSAIGAGAGIAAGTGVVAIAPATAMWVATTFGTASTGTAISTLSGAAATNAALAWLGGGTVANGALGMAGGKALLALAGPIGWGIAGASVLASVVLFATNKKKTNNEKAKEISAVKTNIESTKELTARIEDLTNRIETLKDGVSEQYMKAVSNYGKDYNSLNDDQRYELGRLVNNTKALAKLIGTQIKEDNGEAAIGDGC